MDINVCLFLKNERNRLNLSQKNIADFLGMSVKQVGRWESSIAIPSDKLALLAEIGFDVQYVITGNTSPVAPLHKGDLTRAVRVVSTLLADKWFTIDETDKAELIIKVYEYFQLFEDGQQNQEKTMEKIMKEVMDVIA